MSKPDKHVKNDPDYRMRRSLNDVLTEAINDLAQHGFDSAARIERWMRALREAAEATLTSRRTMERILNDALLTIYKRMVERDGILKYHPGVERFTLQQIKPSLRAELDRRIMASAELIKLNREEAIQKTLQRFAGWSTSIPKGGSKTVNRKEVRKDVRKSIVSAKFAERRVIIDQGTKLVSAINDIVAKDSGAIAGQWVSNFRQAGYDYREEHRERDGKVYVVRDNWASEKGYIKPKHGYMDEITKPAEEPFCLLGDTKIDLFDGAEKVYRRWYEGRIIIISTAVGRVLRTTPNHPIMTPNGWVAAGLLNEGDSVIEVCHESIEATKLDTNQNQPTFAQFFHSMRKIGFFEETRDGMGMNFHGDGSNENINIISFDRPLGFNVQSKCLQAIDHFYFTLADFLLSSIGVIFELRDRFSRSTNGSMSLVLGSLSVPLYSIVERAVIGRTQSLQDQRVRNAKGFSKLIGIFSRIVSSKKFDAIQRDSWSRSKINVAINVPVPNGHGTHAKSGGNLAKRFPLRTQTSNIICIKYEFFAGHVYNLQTATGWFVGNGIIVSNCRCHYRYFFNLRDIPSDMLTEKGKNKLAEVRAEIARSRKDSDDDSNRLIFEAARRFDRLKYLEGLKQIILSPEGNQWHAGYDPDKDEIVIQPKFERETVETRLHIMLHEAGHRGQDVDADTYEKFKKLHLNQISSFLSMANSEHLEAYQKTGKVEDSIASEVFAESYARFMMRLEMPEELRQFWRQRQ